MGSPLSIWGSLIGRSLDLVLSGPSRQTEKGPILTCILLLRRFNQTPKHGPSSKLCEMSVNWVTMRLLSLRWVYSLPIWTFSQPMGLLLSSCLACVGWAGKWAARALSRTVWVLSAFCVLPGMSWWCGLDLLGGTFWQLLWHIALPLMDSNMWTCLSWPLPCRALVPLTWCICVVT